jgi:chromosome segregation ATPase
MLISMRTRWLSWLLGVAALLVVTAVHGPAQAQIFKYTKADGTTGYTDKLSDLPKDRRAYYNELLRKREQERQALESRVGRDELLRREAEAERLRVEQARMDEAERSRQLAAISARLAEYKAREAARAADEKDWRDRVKAAKARLSRLLADFRAAESAYQAIAIQPMHTLLPGQGQKRDEALAAMKALEPQIDAAVEEVEVKIPTEARRAGVPPGWLR